MRHIVFLIGLLIVCPAMAQVAALPIQPGNTITVSASTSASTAVALPIGSVPSWQIELQNAGSSVAFCAFGGSTLAATTSSYPIMPGVDKVVTVDQDRKYISCITASGSATIYATGGIGN